MNTPPPPNNPDAERAVLGAILLDNNALHVALKENLCSGDFFFAQNQKIFRAMIAMCSAGKNIDLITLSEALRSKGAGEWGEIAHLGGEAYISSLADGMPRVSNIKHYATIIREKSARRNALHASESIMHAAWDPDMKVEDAAKLAHALSISLSAWSSDGGLGVLASEISPEKVEWLWAGRIPIGKITVLDGDPGLGKSFLTLDLAARITTGRLMPDGSPGVDGGVLVLNAEDGSADTIVPRLLAMGANLKRVRILKTLMGSDGERQPEIPADLAAIERTAELVKAKLIVVDPLMAFLASETNSFRDQDVRRALAPLAMTAERLGAAVLIVRHLNKNSEGNPIYRGGGSIGIIGAARAGLLVARDPDDQSNQSRILAVTKTNLGPSSPSLRWSIQSDDRGLIRVHWSGESAHQASALLALPSGDEGRTELEEACDFLLATLADGPLPANEVIQKGRAAACSERTLKRAKEKLGVKSRRHITVWQWELPAKDAKPTSNSANTSRLAPFAQATDSKPIESCSSTKDAKDGGMASFDEKVAPFAPNNGTGKVRVVSWNPAGEPIDLQGVGQISDSDKFAKAKLEELRHAVVNPKRKMGWSVSQLVQQLARVGVVVEVSE